MMSQFRTDVTDMHVGTLDPKWLSGSLGRSKTVHF